MAVAFRAVSSGTGTDTTAEGTIPSGSTTGDYMVAFLCSSSSSATITGTPSGWGLQEANPAPADFSTWCYTKAWAASEPAPTWTLSVSGNWTVDIITYSGVDTAGTPVNVDIGEQAAAVNAVALGSITPTVNNCLLLGYAAVDATGGARTWTEDGAMTERIDQVDNQLHRAIAEELLSGGSGVGVTRTFTFSGTAQDVGGFLLALAPSTGPQIEAQTGTVTAAPALTSTDSVVLPSGIPFLVMAPRWPT